VSPAAAAIAKEAVVTESKTFKRRVRERMSKTGESYTSARSEIVQKRERNNAARTRLTTAAEDLMADAKLKAATGRDWKTWISLLDRWGARDHKHAEIARYLMDEHKVPGWWAQTITVGYERTTGLRLKHQQKDGFSVSASKTIGVPVGSLFDAFVKPAKRKRWLQDGTMRVRTSQPYRNARFDWNDGTTRVVVGFIDKGDSKSTVSLAHEKLPDADEAETAKLAWKERLTALKDYLES